MRNSADAKSSLQKARENENFSRAKNFRATATLPKVRPHRCRRTAFAIGYDNNYPDALNDWILLWFPRAWLAGIEEEGSR
jgi:hypothetical protein